MALYRNTSIHRRSKLYYPKHQRYTNPAYQPEPSTNPACKFKTSLVGKHVSFYAEGATYTSPTSLTSGKLYPIVHHRVGYNLVSILDDLGNEIQTSIAPRVSWHLGAVGKFEFSDFEICKDSARKDSAGQRGES